MNVIDKHCRRPGLLYKNHVYFIYLCDNIVLFYFKIILKFTFLKDIVLF